MYAEQNRMAVMPNMITAVNTLLKDNFGEEAPQLPKPEYSHFERWFIARNNDHPREIRSAIASFHRQLEACTAS